MVSLLWVLSLCRFHELLIYIVLSVTLLSYLVFDRFAYPSPRHWTLR